MSIGKLAAYKKIIFVCAGLIVLLGAVVYFISRPKEVKLQITNTNSKQPELRRALDGVLVLEQNLQNKFPVAVLIENLLEARPYQRGLEQAQVVYEAPAEGGITRFLALFDLSTDLKKIGPVRSVRPYYLDWANEYKALIAHSGGSDQALAQIKEDNVFSLNEYYNGKYYWRQNGVPSPHDLFTSSELLASALVKKKAASEGKFTPWKFKNDGPITPSPIKEISVPFSYSGNTYDVKWLYQTKDNVYLRYQAGLPHKTASGAAISAKNVLLMYVSAQELKDELLHISIQTTGQGRLVAFLDGRVIDGKWEKVDNYSRTKLVDSAGQEIKLNAGPIWVEVVPQWVSVSWQ